MTQISNFSVELASLEDIQGIYNIFKQNLLDLRNFDNLSKKKKKELEYTGFLRKIVDIEYYKKLIKDPTIDVFVARSNTGTIIGFLSVYRKISNILEVRDIIGSLSFQNERVRDLLLNETIDFTYLDQVTVLPEYKRKGIATALFQKLLFKVDNPIVAFIVEKPIYNKASAIWHKNNGFEYSAISSGNYKEKKFQFQIYIHWNKK